MLILDEMGYVPLDRMAAQFVFQLVSRCYGRGSIILAPNRSCGEWGNILADLFRQQRSWAAWAASHRVWHEGGL